MKTFFTSLIITLFATHLFAQAPVMVSRANIAMPYEPKLKPFYHGVASGDPLEDRVIIWTRITPEKDETITGEWFMATDTSFKNIMETGTFSTDISIDYTVKIDVTGLQSNTTYYYYFNALSANSIIGRTKTIPSSTGNIDNLKLAVISCANYEGGLFNAYKSLSKRNDIDAVLHLGDYIYEYAPGDYKNPSLTAPHNLLPQNEIINEADYRMRYSLYRLDENLRSAHQQHPFISIWDDHESANDAYADGAENHTPLTEGDWQIRKATSKKVYFEWMPIRYNSDLKTYRSLSLGNLAEVFMLDTRLEGREKPPVNFDDADQPIRKIMSTTQSGWLTEGLKKSTAKWKIIGNQVLFSTFNVGFAASTITDITAIRATENNFIDNWESYPTQRNSIIDSLKKNNIKNTIFVSGDSHCSWAFDVTKNAVLYPLAAAYNIPVKNPYNPATGEGYQDTTGLGSYAVEFGTPSISSQNFDELLPLATVMQFEYTMNNYIPIPGMGNVNYNPHLEYVDLKNHGYFILDLKSDSAQADYYFQSSILNSNSTENFAKAILVKDQNTKINNSKIAASKAKPVQQTPAPLMPKNNASTGLDDDNIIGTIFSIYPNPAKDYILINFSILENADFEITIQDIQGKTVKKLHKSKNTSAGIYQMDYNISDLNTGVYFVTILSSKGKITRKLIVE